MKLTRAQALAVLKAEEAERASSTTQELYSQRDDFEWLRDVTLQAQQRALSAALTDKFIVRNGGMTQALITLHNLRFDPAIRNDKELSAITVCTCDRQHQTVAMSHEAPDQHTHAHTQINATTIATLALFGKVELVQACLCTALMAAA